MGGIQKQVEMGKTAGGGGAGGDEATCKGGGHTALVELLRELLLRNKITIIPCFFGCELDGALPFMKSLLYS